MKHLIILGIALLLFSACGDDGKAQKELEAANLQLVRNYLDAVEDRDFEAMSSMLADNFLALGPSIYDSANRDEAVSAWRVSSSNIYETIEYKGLQFLTASQEDGPAAGDWVLAWANLELWFKDGKGPVALWINAAYKIENGKIARLRRIYNETDVMKQLGYATFPPLFIDDEESFEFPEEQEEEVEEDEEM
ncbi:MAG: nuclear transport factor 2 family protein [Bacteroidota bacterium]